MLLSQNLVNSRSATSTSRLPIATAGILYASILCTLWPMTSKTLQSCVPPLLGHPVRGLLQSPMIESVSAPPTRDTAGMLTHSLRFFVPDSQPKNQQAPPSLLQGPVSYATCQDTSQSTVPTQTASTSRGSQHQQPQLRDHLPAPSKISNSSDINKVEYKYDVEYVYKEGSYVVKGNLRKNLQYWKNVLCVTPYISDIIEFGLKIPFLQTPTPVLCRNNLSARTHSEFVEKAIGELLEAGCIKESKMIPHCVNPLTVSINSSGKGRLILGRFKAC